MAEVGYLLLHRLLQWRQTTTHNLLTQHTNHFWEIQIINDHMISLHCNHKVEVRNYQFLLLLLLLSFAIIQLKNPSNRFYFLCLMYYSYIVRGVLIRVFQVFQYPICILFTKTDIDSQSDTLSYVRFIILIMHEFSEDGYHNSRETTW